LPEKFRDLFMEPGGIFTVGGPRPVEIGQMIRRPALIAGLKFEHRADTEEGLDEILRDAAMGNPTVLPLLEFTLDELWRRSGGSGLLRFSDYEEIGGLNGAIRLRADEVFSSLNLTVRASLPKVLAALVHTDPTDDRLLLQNRVPLSQFFNSPESQALINAFVAAHLFIGDRASDGAAVIGLAHETLLREWPPAVDWCEQNRGLLRVRAGIAAAAAIWRNSSKQDERLITGPLLKDSAKLLSTNPEILAAEERRCVELSLSQDRLRRKRHLVRGSMLAASIMLVILLSLVGLDGLNQGFALARAIPVVWGNGKDIPISDYARTQLDRSTHELAGYLLSQVNERANRPDLNAWGLAQMWVALRGLDPSLNGKTLRQAVAATQDIKCYCWHEDGSKPPNSLATAWVMFALALYDEASMRQELSWFLNRQAPAGWWSMYPASQEGGNASTAATAFIVLAMNEQARHNLVAVDQKARVSEAIDRGISWLVGGARYGKARWTEYPPDHIFERGLEYIAVSALVIHTIRAAKGSANFDPVWLNSLPKIVPAPTEDEQAKGVVFLNNSQFMVDDVRHYRYPWMLRTTIDAYKSGDLLQRARALVWIDAALRQAPTVESLHREGWTMAEILIALRHAQVVLTSQ
jgi:hypothetical protein